MSVTNYLRAFKSFSKNDIRVELVRDHHMNKVMCCFSERKANKNATNGLCQSPGGTSPSTFFPYLKRKEIEELIPTLLAEESQKWNVRFVLHKEMNEAYGGGVILYYSVHLLHSPLVM